MVQISPKDALWVAAVERGQFTRQDLAVATGLAIRTAGKWIERALEDGVVCEFGLVQKDVETAGAPRRVYAITDRGREGALSHLELFNTLAKHQFGARPGANKIFKDPPHFTAEAFLAEPRRILFQGIEAFLGIASLQADGEPFPDKDCRDRILNSWMTSCDSPEDDQFSPVHALRHEARARAQDVGRLVKHWQAFDVHPPAAFVQDLEALQASARDPHAFFIAAMVVHALKGLQPDDADSLSKNSTALAKLLAEQSLSAVSNERGQGHRDLPKLSEAPSWRLLYAVRWLDDIARWREQESRQPAFAVLSIVSAFFAAAAVPNDEPGPSEQFSEDFSLNLAAQTALFRAASMIGWANVARVLDHHASVTVGTNADVEERRWMTTGFVKSWDILERRLNQTSLAESRPDPDAQMMLRGALLRFCVRAEQLPIAGLLQPILDNNQIEFDSRVAEIVETQSDFPQKFGEFSPWIQRRVDISTSKETSEPQEGAWEEMPTYSEYVEERKAA